MAVPMEIKTEEPLKNVIPAQAGIQIALGPGLRRGDELRLIRGSLIS